MSEIKNSTEQTNTKKQEAQEMITLYLSMTALNRAKIFGYAQGIKSMTGKMPERQAG